MNKNLESKARTLFEDIRDLPETDKVKAVLRFIDNELALNESTHIWGGTDMALIQSRASNIFSALSTDFKLNGESAYSNAQLLRTACVAQATYEFLRGKGYIPVKMELHQEKRKLTCDHSEVELHLSQNHAKCMKCEKKLKPLWVEE